MPTQDPLDDHLRSHVRRAQTLVARRLADARAHAAGGSIESAMQRLDELGEGLVQALADARTSFYRRAFHHHRDPAIHDLEARPTKDGEAVARTSLIVGRDQYRDLAIPLADAIAQLRSAVAAGLPALTLWENRHQAVLSQHIKTALSDAQMALHTATGLAITKEELR